ncbi:MAG: RNA polymerase factor sigma-54 [Alphaproteobacteria bacterium]|nr:RNA polymerase factor sigma-54 [Alphaproteobacteria bacterium]
MALMPRLDLRQGQALVMTPQLQQAIKLLQMSSLELSAYVESELEQNPLLERDEASEDGAADEAPAGDAAAEPPAVDAPSPDDRRDVEAGADAADAAETWHEEAGREGEGNLDYAGDPEAWRTRTSAVAADGLPGLDQTLTRPISLREHLLEQLAVEIHDPADRVIGSHLIDMVDEAGYIAGDFAAIAELLSCDTARVEKTVVLLQRFDPPGVFARNLAECLALQLKERDRFDPAMRTLIENLPLLAKRDAQQLMRVCRVDAADLAQMVAEIKALNPKPGLAFDKAAPEVVVPDVLLRVLPNGSWAVELNSDSLPRVLVNNRYYAEVSDAAKNKREKEYLSERYQSANWLVKALHQRATTILKVSREIVRQQDGFLRHGVQHLKPLVLRDIATAIEMHESTVSRVTTNKYMLTPRGIYELKYFFTSAIAAASGEAHSAEAVRFRIRSLIEAESSEILSDDRIVEILMKEGIDIARRTVAKYREAMNIPSSVRRRREKALQF